MVGVSEKGREQDWPINSCKREGPPASSFGFVYFVARRSLGWQEEGATKKKDAQVVD